jgi:hypothetical protein
MRKRSGGAPPASEVESRAIRSSRSLASISWTSMSGSAFSKDLISVRYALISGGSPKTRKRIEPELSPEDPPPQPATRRATPAART